MTLSLKALKPRGAQRLFLFAALGRVPLGLLLAVDAWLMLDSFSYQGLLGVWLLKLAYSPSSLYTLVCVDMLSGPGPPPPPPQWYPRPRRLARPGSQPRKPEGEGGRTKNDPSQCFFTERRTASEQGQGHHVQAENIKFCSMVTSM